MIEALTLSIRGSVRYLTAIVPCKAKKEVIAYFSSK